MTASTFTYSGVNKTLNKFFSGYAGLGNSIQHWSTTGCNSSEYVEFSVQPQGTAQLTLMSLSFAFSRSAEGPQQITVRSSVDGFGSDLFSAGTGENYQMASVPLNGAGFINQASSIAFRIYACNASQSNGTLRLDEIQINALVLPITLLSFTATPEGDRVQLAWSTASEHNADRFRVERSYDLETYWPVSEVAAIGTTNERQYYGVTDFNPRPGANYYRLKQIDTDGTLHLSEVISTIIRVNEPVVRVYPNPANPGRIHVRLWNATDADIRLLSSSGQVLSGRIDRQPDGVDLIFEQSLPPGLYWLDVMIKGHRQTLTVLIR
ncbi:hypothetical protein GCM10028819_52720 [Spirosoma humi]